MAEKVVIAVDVMGGDYGPCVTVPAALSCLQRHCELYLTLVGDCKKIEPHLSSASDKLKQRIDILHTDEVVCMDDKPSVALRNKKKSSMRLAIDCLHSGAASAVVSAGNTGALVAVSRFVLKTHPQVDRPAIASAIPTMHGHCYMLDLGANVGVSGPQLVQFARMGSVLVSALDGVSRPRVALLNIGEEAIKGNPEIKAADQVLSEAASINYVGYVEGDSVYEGVADVVVCDGFIGNVALKSSEGVAKLINESIRLVFKRNWYTKLLGWLSKPCWRQLSADLDPRRYNGASLVGLKGIVVKSHGAADLLSFSNAISLAIHEVHQDIPRLIDANL